MGGGFLQTRTELWNIFEEDSKQAGQGYHILQEMNLHHQQKMNNSTKTPWEVYRNRNELFKSDYDIYADLRLFYHTKGLLGDDLAKTRLRNTKALILENPQNNDMLTEKARRKVRSYVKDWKQSCEDVGSSDSSGCIVA